MGGEIGGGGVQPHTPRRLCPCCLAVDLANTRGALEATTAQLAATTEELAATQVRLTMGGEDN